MKNALRLLFGLAIIFGGPADAFAAPAGAERTQPWNAETSDLEPDASIIYGRLSNGLRYAIRPNHRPQNQVLVRMTIDFGSAAEAENEQGLAHFIEHMAFNGSANVPEGEMVKMLERLGLSFGADTNASTGYTQTQYKLDLPKADPRLIERALFLMRETAREISFNPAAVDRERGVILAEKSARENFGFQSVRAANNLFYPSTFYATRYPIGTAEVIQTASAERMRALYRTYYRPDRIKIIVAGPVDPVAIERELVAKFADWRVDAPPLGAIDQCLLDTNRALTAQSFVHPEVTESISVQQFLQDKRRPDTLERAMVELKMGIASAIISRRMARRSREEDIPFLGGGVTFNFGLCDQYTTIGYGVTGKDSSWRSLLAFTEQTVRQAVEYGFEESEIAEQIKGLDAQYENAAKDEGTESSAAIANALVSLDEDVHNSDRYRQLLWRQIRPFITQAAINAELAFWFRQMDRPQIFLTAKQSAAIPEDEIIAAYAASIGTTIAAPVARATSRFAYTDFGSAGAVVADKTIADLGIRTIRFANGVLLNLKKTDFEDNRVRYSLRIDGGQLHFGKENAVLALLMSATYVSGGLEAHDIEDLRSILAGTTVSPAFGVADRYFGAAGAVAPADLVRQLQVMAAYTTHPGYSENALRLFRRPLPELYARLDAVPGSALSVAMSSIVTDDDPRFTLPPLKALQGADFEMLKTVLGDALKQNRLEIALVGDLDEEAAIAAVAGSFGALPTRANDERDYSAQLQTGWSAKRGNFDIPHNGEANQLAWRRIWTTTGDNDQKTSQSMDLLARVATLRLTDELREKLGATYGVSANSDMSNLYLQRGTFSISTAGDPKDIATIETTVDQVISALVKSPVDPDLFERARKPVLESYADWKKQNNTWLGVAAETQTNPDRLNRFRKSETNFASITANDLWELAKQYLDKPAEFTFRALPDEMISGGAKSAE
ncbi:pitrilysin family protein [Sphingorhabdus sp. EL138]|uniref:M16 family metallopeptidase n=1 Tax=Sphingorhabdus sp. EL138 TaxID=2073156 RepID=UPI0025FCC74A|nr:insulinase family protein [Sphingorhabdus sp. EL138]